MPVSARAINHPDTATIELATVLRTVGDPVRLDIVRALAEGPELTCTMLQQALELPVSTASYHLRLLREAGVTRTRAEGTTRYMSLRRADLDARFPGLVDAMIAG